MSATATGSAPVALIIGGVIGFGAFPGTPESVDAVVAFLAERAATSTATVESR